MSRPIPPQAEPLLLPLLASLPTAGVSPQPPTALLPLLSPILRQRVQLLSSASSDPWLPLLCYDSSKVSQLEKAVRNERLEPHPVSGEVEVDWESDVHIRYKRVDEETLQALLSLVDFGLHVRLVWCVNDEVGGGDGWRIGEVGVFDGSESSWGAPSISAAEDAFETTTTHVSAQNLHPGTNGQSLYTPEDGEDGDEDDDYWAQYDKTPSGNTPAPPEHSSRPAAMTSNLPATDDDSYYAQYGSVQPAMDNHDPDEATQNGEIESSLGKDEITRELRSNLSPTHHPELSETSAAWSEPLLTNGDGGEVDGLVHPRPSSSSSAGSRGSGTVEKLERQAAGREENDIGVKQHIGTSIKSLWRLAKVSGIERTEFERLVKTELDCLGFMDEDD